MPQRGKEPRAIRPFALAVLVTLAGASGCDFGTLDDLSTDRTESASEAMSSEIHRLFTRFEADEFEIREILAAFQSAVDDEQTSRPVKATSARLGRDEVAALGNPSDPAAAAGMILVSEIDCPLAKLEPLLVALNQSEIYPDVYDVYRRSFSTSYPDFAARRTPALSWRNDAQVTNVGKTYRYVQDAKLRALPRSSPEAGLLLLGRSWLPAPAVFTVGGEDSGLTQAYEVDAWYERSPGKTTHVIGLWQHFWIGTLSTDYALAISIILGNLADFDVRLGLVCNSGTPPPVLQ